MKNKTSSTAHTVWLEMLTDGIKDEIQKTQHDLAAKGQESDATLAKYLALGTEIERLQRLAEALTVSLNASAAERALEFERLTKMPKIAHIDAVPGILLVHTTVLFCTHPRTQAVYELGAFRIEIGSNGDGALSVKLFNTTRMVQPPGGLNPKPHPHVSEEGVPCLGNMKEQWARTLASRNVAAIMSLVITFLEHVNIDDAHGKFLIQWPLAQRSSFAQQTVHTN